MKTSVVGETRGYEATMSGLKGESRRSGRARVEERKSVVVGSWRL